MQGGREFVLRAHFGLPTVEAEEGEGRPPIKVQFEIPYFTTSGIQVYTFTQTLCQHSAYPLCAVQVRYLKIIEKSGYQALPWVRYITQNGGTFSLRHTGDPTL